MDKKTLLQWAGLVGLVLSIVACFWAYGSRQLHNIGPKGFGATSAGNLLIENYIPYVLYNGGINTAKDLNVTGGVTFGSSGTTFNKIIEGTCSAGLIGFDTTQTASSTRPYDCAVTGVVSGDVVMITNATTSALWNGANGSTGYGAWYVSGAKASSTSGFITVGVTNATGLSGVPSAPSQAGNVIGSSTQFLIIK